MHLRQLIKLVILQLRVRLRDTTTDSEKQWITFLTPDCESNTDSHNHPAYTWHQRVRVTIIQTAKKKQQSSYWHPTAKFNFKSHNHPADIWHWKLRLVRVRTTINLLIPDTWELKSITLVTPENKSHNHLAYSFTLDRILKVRATITLLTPDS